MTLIKMRRDSAIRWLEYNPILAPGEIGVELDTGLHKVGDGMTAWSDLDYFIPKLVVSDLVDEMTGANMPDLTILFENGIA